MELLNRYRNITVLLLVIFAQLVLLAYQVKGKGDVRLLRVWAVTAVTPAAKVADTVRGGVSDFVRNYLAFKDLSSENKQLKQELSKYKLDNQRLRTELETADRLRALATFQASTPSKTLPARVIATGTGANSRMVFLDRGARAGVMQGMPVITPDGIVGKVIGSYPTAAQVLLVTDPTFAAGAISQKHRVRGMVRGLGQANCRVDYIPNEQQVDLGEQFFTSGDDGVFPRGLPVGKVTAVRLGNSQYKEVSLTPSGFDSGLEEVLVIVQGAHLDLPELKQASKEVYLQAPPPSDQPPAPIQAVDKPQAGAPVAAPPPVHNLTEADRLRQKYRELGEAQGHTFGEGLPGSKPPDFNVNPEEAARAARARAAAAAKAEAKPGTSPPAQSATPPKPGTETAAPEPR